ncbi:MAG: DUF502 domain-containing protein [Bacillota bacterium]|nr:DUF502 domain-containing protein [Bacillota bacterium]
MVKRLRNYLITGAIVLVPVVLTWYVLLSLFRFLDGLTAQWVAQVLGHAIPGLGLLVTVFIVLTTGILTRSFLGRELINMGQSILSGTPIVRGVYVTMKQIVDAFTVTDQTAFKRVALVEYPRRELWAIAFVTADGPQEACAISGEELVSVFLPTTPNPTSGYLIMLPKRDVKLLEMSVEDGLKLVVSGGVFAPVPGGAPRDNRRSG